MVTMMKRPRNAFSNRSNHTVSTRTSALLLCVTGAVAMSDGLAQNQRHSAEPVDAWGRDRELESMPAGTPAGLADSDWADIRSAYEAARHTVRASGDGFVAENPGQAFQAAFDGRGFTLQPTHGAWTWGLELEGYGWGAAHSIAVRPEDSTAAGGRVAYHWDGVLTEWYLNDTRGLEHGFTVHERSADARGPLQLSVNVRGGLHPSLTADGRDVHFVDASGAAVLDYRGLVAFDADGVQLDAAWRASESGLVLTVEDTAARYPLTIDPIAQQAYIKASNSESADLFGWSVAVDGDIAVVGAPGEDSFATGVNGDESDNSLARAGAAYVFVRTGTTWSQEAYLKASNTEAGDWFGRTVAISGDTIVIASPGEDSNATGVNGNEADNSSLDSGALYVFVRNAGVWAQVAYLKASNTGANDQFGISLAMDRDTIVAGAWTEDSDAVGVGGDGLNDNASESGAAYVFFRSGATWAEQAYLKASNTDPFDFFGYAVAVDGDTAVVTAFLEDSNAMGVNGNEADNSAMGAGAGYVFVRNGATWTQEAYMKASNTESFDLFGVGVDCSDDTIVIGAASEDSNATGVNGDEGDNSLPTSGAAYVFVRAATVWSQEAYIKASNTDMGDAFGESVALAGDTLLIGARFEGSAARGIGGDDSDNSAPAAGAAYLFARAAGSWSQSAYLKASNTDANDQFGNSVSMSGDTLVIGARREGSTATGVNGDPTINTAASAGAMYVIDLMAPAIGINFCAANPNTTGMIGTLSATGSTSVTANNLALVAADLPNSVFGFFVNSQTQGNALPPGSQGRLCLDGAIGRYDLPMQIMSSGATGSFTLSLDLAQTPTPTAFVQIAAGEVWHFQAWHRDIAGGSPSSNFTQGLSVQFTP